MAKFVYRMQSILDVKLKMEEQAKQAFAAAKIKVDEEQAKLEQLQTRKTGYEQRARELLLQKLDFLEIEANHNAIDRMDEFIALQRQQYPFSHVFTSTSRSFDSLHRPSNVFWQAIFGHPASSHDGGARCREGAGFL